MKLLQAILERNELLLARGNGRVNLSRRRRFEFLLQRRDRLDRRRAFLGAGAQLGGASKFRRRAFRLGLSAQLRNLHGEDLGRTLLQRRHPQQSPSAGAKARLDLLGVLSDARLDCIAPFGRNLPRNRHNARNIGVGQIASSELAGNQPFQHQTLDHRALGVLSAILPAILSTWPKSTRTRPVRRLRHSPATSAATSIRPLGLPRLWLSFGRNRLDRRLLLRILRGERHRGA